MKIIFPRQSIRTMNCGGTVMRKSSQPEDWVWTQGALKDSRAVRVQVAQLHIPTFIIRLIQAYRHRVERQRLRDQLARLTPALRADLGVNRAGEHHDL
ncbi:DUF1127 domain-containing protein [Xaviernesmea oryzae]|uniref:DUF1127 domain-containing protein n=1 Tax=Xaviernesmea oryzae TaxID=464029 RepID=UPI0011140AB1|nr:DUF1127 domain-containing protein [Xaviernesmea oryzae]